MKAVIFDIGNVIVPNRWDLMSQKAGLSLDKYQAAFLKDRVNHFNKYERGEITKQVFADYVLGNLGLQKNEDMQKILYTSWSYLWDIPDMDVVNIIKQINFKIKKGILSNTFDVQVEKLVSYKDTDYDFLSHFNPKRVCLSSQIGSKKPEKKAYATIVERLGVLPEECYFFDDKLENIEHANSFGMKGILYSKPKQIEEVIKSIKF